MKKLMTKILLLVTVLGTMLGTALPAQAATSDNAINASAALAVDLNTGKILYNQNAKQVLPIASMTKILTLYLVREAIADKKISFSDEVTITKNISKLSKDPNLSNVPVTTGEKYTVKELYESGWIYSSNAAAMALADKVAGSQDKFVDLMLKQLKKWGITNAQIVNVSGLNNSDLPANMRVAGTDNKAENKISAEDLAVVASHVLKEFPETLEITKTVKKTFAKGRKDEFVMTSFNRMLPGQPDALADLKVDGLKTGTTTAAGESFVGTIKQNGFRIVTVVMHANGAEGDLGKRFKATGTLMRKVYNEWSPQTAIKKGDTSLTKAIKLKYGKESSVKLEAANNVVVWNHNDQVGKTSISLKAKTKDANSAKKGEAFGEIKVASDGLGYLPGSTGDVNLVAVKTVDQKNLFERLIQGIGEFFSNLF